MPNALIPRELLADSQRAQHLLSDAQAQAEAILQQAREQSEQLLKHAQDEFWQRANRQLECWEIERQNMCEQLEKIATSVTHQVVGNLLELTPPAERISALLKKLLTAEIPAIEATLVCHPQDQPEVVQWLQMNSNAPWSLRLDDLLSVQSLVLETDEGSFHIDWKSTVDSLFLLEMPQSRK
ncbi:type III secretion system stator protein SctL [Pseudomonas allii]|uniref:Type III secretion system stator protein SctL n=1 Tax=Pseudomonas allii TaxID=2740531 RepID=A0ACC6LES2_9PSED|nr:type III secretion system stator protein SctL [Pseudomonas allii]MDR9876813.1 type III secretion system stator protein SctL [Pseudomonas allii]